MCSQSAPWPVDQVGSGKLGCFGMDCIQCPQCLGPFVVSKWCLGECGRITECWKSLTVNLAAKKWEG